MIYKLSKSKVVVATLLLLTAKTMDNATLASNGYGNNSTPSSHENVKIAIHNWSTPGMLGGLLMMGLAWHRGNKKHLVYSAIGLSASVVVNYCAFTGIPDDYSVPDWYTTYQKYEGLLFSLSALCFAAYLLLKLLPEYLGEAQYFGLAEKLNLKPKDVAFWEQAWVRLSFCAGLAYFAMHICVPPSFADEE